MIKNLVKGQTINFNYGKKQYILGIHTVTDKENYMHVREMNKYDINVTMNVDKVSKGIIWMYDYNMMGVRTKGKMYISNITDMTLVQPHTF